VSRADDHTPGIGSRAGALFFSQWLEFDTMRRAVVRKQDTDTIHDLRVASRRMRATLGLFSPFISQGRAKRLTCGLRAVTRSLSRLRNIDEAVLHFEPLFAQLPHLASRLAAARRHEAASVAATLASIDAAALERRVRRAVFDLVRTAHHPETTDHLLVHLSRISVRRYLTMHDLFLPAMEAGRPDRRHALRIAIKKWRYLLEALEQVCGHDYTCAINLLKEYQGILGRLNDMQEFSALCRELSLPADERAVVEADLGASAADWLGRFFELASTRRPTYSFFSLTGC
jgi:CHAD domain-containing protein